MAPANNTKFPQRQQQQPPPPLQQQQRAAVDAGPPRPKSAHVSVIRKVGLEGMSAMMRYYGVKMESPSRRNENRHDTKYRFLLIPGILFALFHCVVLSASLRHADPQQLSDLNRIVLLIRGLTVLILQIHLYAHTTQYRDLLYHLADTVHAISNSAQHGFSPAPTPTYVRLWVAATLGAAIVSVVTNAVCRVVLSDIPWWDFLLQESVAESPTFRAVVWGDRITSAIWCLSVDSLPIFQAAVMVQVCVMLVNCFDKILTAVGLSHHGVAPSAAATNQVGAQKIKMDADPGLRESPLATMQHNHARLCRVANDANRVFAPFMLATMVSEVAFFLINATAFSREGVLEQQEDCKKYLTGFYACALLAKFLLKARYCSLLNTKIYSSLGISAPPLHSLHEGVPFSSGFREETHYLIYLNHICINKIKMMYGCLFSVQKSSVIMIIGAVVAYIGLLHTGRKSNLPN